MNISERVLRRYKIAGDPRLMGYGVPKGTPEVKPEGTDLVMFPWEMQTARGMSYGLVAFMGKQSRAFHNYSYGTRKQDRDKAMDELIENRKAHFKRKEDERAEKKQFTTGLFYGDILYTSWGYDQTNVDFYEVVEVVGPKMIKVREVSKKIVTGDGFSDKVVAVPGKYVGPEIKAMVGMGDRAKIEGHGASKWDGKPVYQTGAYGGH